MTYTIAVCTVKNSWWWTEELSETCRVFIPKNKFEKLMHLVGFIIRIYHDAWSPERHTVKSGLNELWIWSEPFQLQCSVPHQVLETCWVLWYSACWKPEHSEEHRITLFTHFDTFIYLGIAFNVHLSELRKFRTVLLYDVVICFNRIHNQTISMVLSTVTGIVWAR